MSPPTSTPSDRPPADRPTPDAPAPDRSGAHRRPGRTLRVWILAWIVAGALAGLGGLVVMQGGLFDTSATTPDNPVVAVLLHHTMIRAVQVRAADDGPVPPVVQTRAARGLVLYQAHCSECHGAPGQPRAAWTAGLSPTPPFLLDAAWRWSPAELRRIIGEGVKMSAMPGWSASLSGNDIQALVDALEVMPDETASAYARATKPAPSGSPPPASLQAASPPLASPRPASP